VNPRSFRARNLVRILVMGALLTPAVASATPAAASGAPTIGSPNTATAEPPLTRPRTTPCVVTLFTDVVFADFSPKPFAYAPPAACAGRWSKVVLEADFTVAAGRQFDRTANLWIGGANVFFGTTAEPSRTVARSWHVERDLTDYAALLSTAQAGEADLGNLVNGTYTSAITGSARLVIYPAGHGAPAAHAADVVLPLSAGATGGSVALSTTASTLARSFTLPPNVERAYLDVIAQSQSADEFWYTCVPDDVASTLQSCGGSGFREAEIAIDGQPAGIAPVFPWIFTGGIDPYLWQPIPGLHSLSFQPHRVDLTPFAALLSDGRPHEVAVGVFNANNYFAATATLLLYLDHGSTRVTGGITRNTLAAAPAPVVKEDLKTAADGTTSGTVTVSASRRFAIEGWAATSHGRVRTTVEERVDFVNRQTFTISAASYAQQIAQSTTFESRSRSDERGRRRERLRQSSWPLTIGFVATTNADGSSSQVTTVRQEDESSHLTSLDGLPVDFAVSTNVVSNADTLSFSSTGAFLGPSNQSSTQDYFAADVSGCFSRSLASAAGLLTAVKDGALCW
jgi:hypothetical protein